MVENLAPESTRAGLLLLERDTDAFSGHPSAHRLDAEEADLPTLHDQIGPRLPSRVEEKRAAVVGDRLGRDVRREVVSAGALSIRLRGCQCL